MTKNEIKQLTDEELNDILCDYYRRIHTSKSTEEFYALDEERNPYMIEDGQRIMRNTRANMTQEEWNEIVD